ncbi:MAG: serine O-acetyltransferase EpsC [Polyangiaceae bacterium]|jgi:serine O-acetyltransferase
MRVLREVARDTLAIARWFSGGQLKPQELRTAIFHDSSHVLMLSRIRQAAERSHIPLVSGIMRRVQTSFFGIEIARDVKLGEGVFFMHTVGIVLGGDSQIGDRVMFLGGNTLGAVDRRGYPRIGNDVVIGAGARILGPVTVGDGASIGANAVVLCDVPPGASAVGVPAVVRAGGAKHSPRVV